MKKIVFILFLILSIVSCTDQMDYEKPLQVGLDGKIEAELTVVVPEVQLPSRALSETPYIYNLYLAVFDEAGYLLEYVKAEATSANMNGSNFNYKVKLMPTSYPTTIHFIGNAPTSVSFGTELEVIGKMSTWGETDAYWQQVKLQNGIKVDEDTKQLNDEVKSLLDEVQLIRNFSWIKLVVDEGVNNFVLDSYCVINTRDKGAVAPYNATRKKFENFNAPVTHAGLVALGYEAYIPEDANLNKQIPNEMYWGNEGFFIYERESPQSEPLYILMKGTYKNGNNELPNRYYKIDLRDNNGGYFPVLRNFKYQVNLKSVGHQGHASAIAAQQGAGSGDVSTSIETESFNNISNSKIRLWVSYTDTTLVSSDDITLKYKFELLEGNNQIQNENLEIKLDESLSDENKVISKAIKASADDDDGWRTITINLKEAGDHRKTESITLVGTYETYTLQRKVRFTLMEKMPFRLACDPGEIADVIGSPFDLLIQVPGGLGKAIFPLDFELEAEDQSMTPNLGDNLPVVSGSSIISGNNKTTIGFIKSVSWSEYEDAVNENGYKTIRCHFKSNKAKSATEIYAQNKYFNLEYPAILGNYTPYTFSDLQFEPEIVTAGSNVVFSFNMSTIPEQGNVTVTLDGLEPAESETKLIYLGVKDGKAQYSFTTDQTNGNSFNLVPTVTSGVITVKLEAYHFTPNERKSAIGLIIPAGNIKVGSGVNNNIGNNTLFTLHTSNPGKSGSAASFASFTANQNGSNPSDIVINNTVYEEVVEDYIYVRYYKSSGFLGLSRTYYVATVKLSDLLKTGGATLSFSEP